MSDPQVVTVALADRAYDIHIGAGILGQMTAHVPVPLHERTAFIITDRHVAPYVSAPIKAQWPGRSYELVLPPGEASKNPDTLHFVLSWMLSNGADRGAVVIAAGGGVIGDLAGLAAALLMRGVPYIQVPTTLLAQVDSAVGGKTAVNMPQGKNMIGAFHQPAAVISDTALLRSLPEREMRAGYAEILKYALIDDADFFAWLEDNGAAILAHDPAALAYAVDRACRKKAAIVAQDERDEGVRMLLNLGHTFAHGIEAAAGYDNSVLHGEAVAAGLAMAAEFSQAQGLCDDAARVAAHLQARGLPTGWRDLLPVAAADDMIAAMGRDKKAKAGRMTFILSRGIGRAFVARDIDMSDVARFIKGSA